MRHACKWDLHWCEFCPVGPTKSNHVTIFLIGAAKGKWSFIILYQFKKRFTCHWDSQLFCCIEVTWEGTVHPLKVTIFWKRKLECNLIDGITHTTCEFVVATRSEEQVETEVLVFPAREQQKTLVSKSRNVATCNSHRSQTQSYVFQREGTGEEPMEMPQ